MQGKKRARELTVASAIRYPHIGEQSLKKEKHCSNWPKKCVGVAALVLYMCGRRAEFVSIGKYYTGASVAMLHAGASVENSLQNVPQFELVLFFLVFSCRPQKVLFMILHFPFVNWRRNGFSACVTELSHRRRNSFEFRCIRSKEYRNNNNHVTFNWKQFQ